MDDFAKSLKTMVEMGGLSKEEAATMFKEELQRRNGGGGGSGGSSSFQGSTGGSRTQQAATMDMKPATGGNEHQQNSRKQSKTGKKVESCMRMCLSCMRSSDSVCECFCRVCDYAK